MFYAFVSVINTLEPARDFNVKLYSMKHGWREAVKGRGRGADHAFSKCFLFHSYLKLFIIIDMIQPQTMLS